MDSTAQIIIALATLLGVVINGYVSIRNSFAINTVKAATDGMKTELVSLTATSSKAEGVLQGRAEVHEEQASR